MSETAHIETYTLIREDKDKGLESLYERYGKKLYSYGITSWKLEEDDAWDMVYSALYKIVEKVNDYEFETEKKFSSFLFTVFCNLLRRHYRDNKRREEQLSFSNFNESRFDESRNDLGLQTERKVQEKITAQSVNFWREEDQPENIRMKCLQDALDEMEDWQRILLLQRAQNRPYNEIADFINKPANQLKVYYQRATKKLEKILKEKLAVIQKAKIDEA